jgi:hypothetical protein
MCCHCLRMGNSSWYMAQYAPGGHAGAMPSLARPVDGSLSAHLPPELQRPDPIKACFRPAVEVCNENELSPRGGAAAVAAIPATTCMAGATSVHTRATSCRRRRRQLPHAIPVERRGQDCASSDHGHVHVHPRHQDQVLAAGFHVKSYKAGARNALGNVMPSLAAGGPKEIVGSLCHCHSACVCLIGLRSHRASALQVFRVACIICKIEFHWSVHTSGIRILCQNAVYLKCQRSGSDPTNAASPVLAQ